MRHFRFSAFVNSTSKFWFAILCGQAQKFKKRGVHRVFDIPKNSDQAQKFKKRGVHRIFDIPKNNDCKLVSVLDVFLGIYRNFWNNLLVKHVQTVSPHSHRWLKCFMGECGKECRSNKGQINEFFLTSYHLCLHVFFSFISYTFTPGWLLSRVSEQNRKAPIMLYLRYVVKPTESVLEVWNILLWRTREIKTVT